MLNPINSLERSWKMKKLMMVLFIASILTFAACMAIAETSGTCGLDGDNLTWELDDQGVLTISGSGRMRNYSSITFGGDIKAPWGEDVKKVVICDGVTSIGELAFLDCDSLESITIPDSVTDIGESAFAFCGNLKSITLPKNVATIGDKLFDLCDQLLFIDVSEENTHFASYDGCLYDKALVELIRCPNGKKNVVFPDTILKIRDRAFSWCNNLSDIELPDGLISIGDEAFYMCNLLRSVKLSHNVSYMGKEAFDMCLSLHSIDVDENNGFYSSIEGCLYDKKQETIICCPSTKTQITLPDSLVYINDGAFFCCDISNIELPNSVKYIGEDAFCLCEQLQSITIPYGITNIKHRTFSYCESMESISLPESLIGISWSAFYGCNSLESIIIPDEVKTIDPSAFKNCDAILYANENTSASSALLRAGYDYTVLGNKGTWGNLNWSIDGEGILSVSGTGEMISFEPDSNNAWLGKKDSLTEVHIGEGVTSIGDLAFRDCSSLTTITIPSSVTTVGSGAFVGCTGLKRFTVSIDNDYLAAIDGVLFSKPDRQLLCYPPNMPDDVYQIPKGIKEIGDSAFNACKNLKMVIIPDSVTSIDDYAFNGCTNLLRIVVPDSVTMIGAYAFNDCSSLKEITLPDAVVSIGQKAFPLAVVIRTAQIDSAAAQALSKAGYSFRLPDTQYDLRFLFKNDLISGLELLNADKNITDVLFTDGITQIGENAFSDCIYLTSVTIPEGVEAIEDRAFYGCQRLASVIIPGSVVDIGDDAFTGSEQLIITVDRNSYAKDWCLENGIEYTYSDILDWLNDDYVFPSTPTPTPTPEMSSLTTYENASINPSSDKASIMILQKLLKEQGWFDSDADGIYSTSTVESVLGFQSYVNAVSGYDKLVVSGIADEDTLDALMSGLYINPASATVQPSPTATPIVWKDVYETMYARALVNGTAVYRSPDLNDIWANVNTNNEFLLKAVSDDWLMIINPVNNYTAYVLKNEFITYRLQKDTPAPTATPAPTPT